MRINLPRNVEFRATPIRTTFGRSALISFRPLVVLRRRGFLGLATPDVSQGGTARASVVWRNAGNISQMFDIVVKYYIGGVLAFSGRVDNVSTTPGEEKTTNVDVVVPDTAEPGVYSAIVVLTDEMGSTRDSATYDTAINVVSGVAAEIISTVFSSI